MFEVLFNSQISFAFYKCDLTFLGFDLCDWSLFPFVIFSIALYVVFSVI